MKIKRVNRPPSQWKRVEPETLAAWGVNPFAPRDEVDGTRVGGYRLVRAPDGSLVGVADPIEPKADR
jgi:hypothetical protein